MAINTIFQLAVLAVEAWIQTGKIGDRLQFFFRRWIIMFKATLVSLGTWATQVVIVTKFVICCTSFDLVKNGSVDSDRLVKSSRPRIPRGFGPGRSIAILHRERGRNGWRRSGIGCDSSIC